MGWDEPTAALVTRVTARLSALVFAGYLAAHAGRALPGGTIRRGLKAAAPRLFGAFVVAHTVHFAAVATLAAVTRGESIDVRGGPVAAGALGVLFYVAVYGIWRAERATTRFLGWLRVVAVTLLWAAFAQAYLLRLGESVLFVALGVALILSFAGWLVSLRARV